MEETKFARKLDSSGRLVIPIRLREQLHLNQGDIYRFLLHEENGKTYLCIECPNSVTELEGALAILRKNGYEITEE